MTAVIVRRYKYIQMIILRKGSSRGCLKDREEKVPGI